MNVHCAAGGGSGRTCGGSKTASQSSRKGKASPAGKKKAKAASKPGKDGKKKGRSKKGGGGGEDRDDRKRKGGGDKAPSKKKKEKKQTESVTIKLINVPKEEPENGSWREDQMEQRIVKIQKGESLRHEVEQAMVEGVDFAVSVSPWVVKEVNVDAPVEELGIPMDGSAVLYIVPVVSTESDGGDTGEPKDNEEGEKTAGNEETAN